MTQEQELKLPISEVPEAPNFFGKSLRVRGGRWALVFLEGVSLALLSCTMDQLSKPFDQAPDNQVRQEQSSLQNKDPKVDQSEKVDDRLTLEKLLTQKPNLLSEFGQQIGGTDQDFAQTFDLFVNNGATFKSKVLYVQMVRLGEGDIKVIQSYDFWKNTLGFETSADGKVKKVEELRRRDIVRVDDFGKPLGIFFRETADGPLDPSADFTYNGDFLTILEGSQIAVDHNREVAKKMFKVEQVRFYPGSGWLSREYYSAGGWIDGEYFELVERPDTAS